MRSCQSLPWQDSYLGSSARFAAPWRGMLRRADGSAACLNSTSAARSVITMSRDIDALTSYTLKHLRDRWWTPRWTHWVSSHLRCDPGERLVHVGCGNGEIDVALALATPGLSVVSIDVQRHRARHTRELAGEVDVRLHAVAGDLRALPLAPATADAVLCIGVLQHLADPAAATRALAALVRPGGRILVVEPDHEARYWFSGAGAGERAFATARDTLGGWQRESAPDAPARLGVHVVSWLRDAGLEPLSVEAVPVSESRLGRAAARGVGGPRASPGRRGRRAGPGRRRRRAARGRRRLPRRSRRPGRRRSSRCSTPCSSPPWRSDRNSELSNAGMPKCWNVEGSAGFRISAFGIRHCRHSGITALRCSPYARRPRRLGRLCALLRLGERPHDGPPRPRVLAAARQADRRPGARTRKRHGPADRPAPPPRHPRRRRGPDGGDAPAGGAPGAPRPNHPPSARSRRRHAPALCGRQLPPGHGAVRACSSHC